MLAHHKILWLRPALPGGSTPMPVYGHFRDHYFARSVMEVKQHLLRCLRNMKPQGAATPDFILLDAGAYNHDIKSELELWLEKHPRLRRIKVKLPPPRPWAVRLWTNICRLTERWFNSNSSSPSKG